MIKVYQGVMINRMLQFEILLRSCHLLNLSRMVEVDVQKILCHRWWFNGAIKGDQRMGMLRMFNISSMIVTDGTIQIER